MLADVRRHPGSRRLPWFGRESLEAALGERYVHLPELGGRRRPVESSPNSGWRNPQFQGYADHMGSEEFAAGVERLLSLRRPVAAMCAEGPWWRCHRRLLADALVARAITVEHVMPDGRLSAHELTDFAVVERGRVTYPPLQGTL
jgi:uncharacterized protein (DUF488 family)